MSNGSPFGEALAGFLLKKHGNHIFPYQLTLLGPHMTTRRVTKYASFGIIFIGVSFLIGSNSIQAAEVPKNFVQVNDIMDRLCTKTINTAKTLHNADVCRSAATDFVKTHATPDAETFEFREYKAAYVQSICNAPFAWDGINQPNGIKKSCYEDGAEEFAEHTPLNDLGRYCEDYHIGDSLSCNINLLESIRRAAHTEVQIFDLMKTRQNVYVEALRAKPEDGPSYVQINDLIDRLCTRTIPLRYSIENGEICRKTSFLFVVKYIVPPSTTLEFKRYKLGMVQSICTASYKDDVQKSPDDVRSVCWSAAIDHLSIESSCSSSDLLCKENIIANVKATVEAQIVNQHMITKAI